MSAPSSPARAADADAAVPVPVAPRVTGKALKAQYTKSIPNGSSNDPSKKKRKLKSGTKALRDIRKIQKSDKPVLPRAPFKRLIKEIMDAREPGMRITSSAVDALREQAEQQLTAIFSLAQALEIDVGHRITLSPKTYRVAVNLMMSDYLVSTGRGGVSLTGNVE